MKSVLILISVVFLLQATLVNGQDKTYAEMLGYPKGSKVLIIHVDDAGMSYESNLGVERSIENGIATSCSIMMPCPWVPGFMHYLSNHQTTDAGIHLTLTSEWKDYRWGPISGKKSVPGLVDKEGAMWQDVSDVVKHATPDEVEVEIRAQIDKAISMGWKPTHLDSHMGTLFGSAAFIQRYVKVGLEYKIPVMFPAGNGTLIKKQMNLADAQMAMMRAVGNQLWNGGLPVIDDLHNESYDWQIPTDITNDSMKLQDFKTNKYIEAFKALQPGVTMMIMHCTATSDLFKNISNSGPTRNADLFAMLNPALKQEIKNQGIILTTWRELMERRSKIK